jgi:cytidine deaminase
VTTNADRESKLLQLAVQAQQNALADYSHFKVGAALEAADGRVFTGCNVENASLGLTVCAERVALWKALSEGAREFTAIAVVGSANQPVRVCGACRQLLWEYCGEISVYMHGQNNHKIVATTAELLPYAFDRTDLLPE